MNRFSVGLSIILYILIFLIRYQQGGWMIQFDAFRDIRSSLDQRISQYLPSPQAELLSGIMLGQNKTLPADFKLALRDTSTLHIVVASGQNLSIVAGFFLLLSGLIKKKLAIILSFFAIILFTLLTGFQVPILRAAIMVSLAFLGKIFGREGSSIWILVVTGGLMLLINPSWLTDISFQLSFLSTMGVVVASPIFLQIFKKLPIISQDLATSLSAQLLVFPVIAQNFHQLSLVSLPTNVLILWTVPITMVGGAIMLLLSLVLPPLASLVALFLNGLLTYFVYIVEYFAHLSWSWVYVGEQIWLVWIGYYLIVLAVLVYLKNVQAKD